jgi:glycosyltransferase involved in cell wall biosynthesis
MRILTLTYEYPPVGGGGGRVASELARQLVTRGHEIDVVTMRYRDLPREESPDGRLRVYRVASLRRRIEVCRTHEMLTYVFMGLRAALRLCRRNQYDVCHAHFILPTGLVAMALNRLTGLPYLLSAHGSDVPGYNPDRFNYQHLLTPRLIHNVARRSIGTVVPSEFMRHLVHSCAPEATIDVVPHGIDARKFVPATMKSRAILVVTRMLERKGVQYLLEALQGFDLQGFTVNLVGDGPYLKTLRSIAKRRQLSVKFWGWLDGDSRELRELYERSAIFVMPSEAESFGLVLLDAMCAGLAVITAHGCACEEVTGDTAILVPPRDAAAIRAALARLIGDPGLCAKLGQMARARAEQVFDWPALALRYETLMREGIA